MKLNIQKIFKGDLRIWTTYWILLLISTVISMSTTFVLDVAKEDIFYHYKRHFLYLFIGFVIAWIIANILNGKFLNLLFNLSNLIIAIAIIMQIFTALFGKEIYEAKRWLIIGGISIQTSEIVKIALIIFTAKEITKYLIGQISVLQLLKKVAIVSVIAILPIVIYDLSTAAIILTIIFLQLLVALPKNWAKKLLLIYLAGVILALLTIAIMPSSFARLGTWKKRISTFINNSYKPYEQPIQAKVAIATSKLFRFRPGKSNQRFVLQQVFSDYAYSVIIEEYGAIGGISVIALYVYLMIIAVRLISKLKRIFPMLLVVGFIIAIELQTFIHILVNVGLIPVTGQPLPIISLGGTNIIITSTMIGIILLISRFVKENIEISNSEPYNLSFDQNLILNLR